MMNEEVEKTGGRKVFYPVGAMARLSSRILVCGVEEEADLAPADGASQHDVVGVLVLESRAHVDGRVL